MSDNFAFEPSRTLVYGLIDLDESSRWPFLNGWILHLNNFAGDNLGLIGFWLNFRTPHNSNLEGSSLYFSYNDRPIT